MGIKLLYAIATTYWDQLRDLVFQQDNAQPHVPRICRDYLITNNANVFPRPAVSPDPSPVEHLWDILNRRVRARNPTPYTLQELRRALTEEVGNITVTNVNRLINPLHCRTRAAIASRRGHKRY